jgi:hypothetical protein
MTKKTRTRLNKTLHCLRQAQDLLEGISIADGREVFDSAYLTYTQLTGRIADLAPLAKKAKAA